MTNAAERDGILADVIAEPHSDTSRHVYADWMEEFGGAAGARRAQFVRAQLRNKLDVEVEPSWDGPVMGWWGRDGTTATWFDDGLRGIVRVYRRGFVRRVEMPLYEWFRRGPGLVRTLPLEEVRATDREPWLRVVTGRRLWYMAEGAQHPAALPEEIYGLLPAANHPDGDSAHAALSAAMLLWARKQRL